MSLISSLAKTFRAVIFSNDRFECTLEIGNNLEFRIYECPGIWCSDEQLGQLHRDMQQVAEVGQDGKEVPEYGALLGSRKDFETRILSIAYDKKTGRPVGFSAQSYLDIERGSRREKVLHLGLIFVDPTLRGRNLTYLLSVLPNIVIFLKTGMRAVWVSNVSQVPAILGIVTDNYSKVYPTPGFSSVQSFEQRWLSQEIMARHRDVFGVGPDADFDLDKQIIRNSYTGGSDHLKKTFPEAPKYRRPEVNEACERELDYKRGDDYLQLGLMDLGCYVNLARKKTGAHLGRRVMINLIFMGFFGLILPSMRWLIPVSNVNKGSL